VFINALHHSDSFLGYGQPIFTEGAGFGDFLYAVRLERRALAAIKAGFAEGGEADAGHDNRPLT
jgi:hypothetical protein